MFGAPRSLGSVHCHRKPREPEAFSATVNQINAASQPYILMGKNLCGRTELSRRITPSLSDPTPHPRDAGLFQYDGTTLRLRDRRGTAIEVPALPERGLAQRS